MKPSLLITLALFGGAAYVLTRKSDEATKSQPPPPPVPEPTQPTQPTMIALPPLPALVITPTLDSGLTADEHLAVQNALSKETSAANLTAFASTFDPIFPVAASVLRARASDLGKV